jgi:hypothetical protein
METCSLHGVIVTDFVKAVKVASDPTLLGKMGREGNLPLYESLLIMLARNPNISLRHVKAHGDYKKNKKWTRPQWGNYYADLIAKNDSREYSRNHLEWSLLPLERIVRSNSKWHWIQNTGHLLLDSLPKAIQAYTHLQYMKDRDEYRAKRELPIKWQSAKVGLINDLWKPAKSTLKAKAYAYRLTYDKGWHGGNRGKSAAPDTQTEEEWAACGLCKLPDSQHHWIRECKHPAVATAREAAEDKVLEILLELRKPTSKKVKYDRDLLTMAEILHDFANTALHGEHIWLGIIHTNMIQNIRERGYDFPLTDSKPTPRANKWKKTVLRVITPLLDAAKEMWAIKETSRRETLMGCLTDAERRTQARIIRQRGDIRSYFQRLEHKLGSLRHSLETSHNIDTTPTSELLRDSSVNRDHHPRLSTARPAPPPPTPTVRWRNTLIQDHFTLNRRNSHDMLAKHPLPNGRTPTFRTVEFGTWYKNIDLRWLPPKVEERRAGHEDAEERRLAGVEDGRNTEAMEIDIDLETVDREQVHNNNLLFFNSKEPHISVDSNIISCDSVGSRSSSNNLAVDDATKKRGVG